MHAPQCSYVVYNNHDRETAQVSATLWVDKGDAVCAHDGILLSYEKGWNHAMCSNMDRQFIILSEESQAEKDKYLMISLTCEV